MNEEKAMQVLDETFEMAMISLEMANKENKEHNGVIDCARAPLVRDLTIACEKALKGKYLLKELDDGLEGGDNTLRRAYPAYWNDGESLGRQRRSARTGQYMDGGNGNYGRMYRDDGNEEARQAIQHAMQKTTDRRTREILEEALQNYKE